MDSGYTQRVLDALRMTLVPEQASVDEGTRLLKEVLYKEGPFPAVLLTLAVSKEIPVPLRRSAIVMLKHEVTWKWMKVKKDSQDRFCYSDDVKKLVKDSFLEAMMICEDKKSMTLFGEVINFILMKGEKKEWPDLEEKVFEGLKSAGSDLTKIFAYLTAYEGICESRKMLINAKRKPINQSSEIYLPYLIQIASEMVKTHSETNACILQTLLSCIEKITRLDVPPVLRKLDVDALWMQAYKSILEYAAQGLKSLKSSGTIQEDLDDSDYSLIIQRTSNILKRFAQRYGTNDTKDFADYCKNWTENHGPSLWFVLLQLIKNASEIGIGEETMKCLIKSASFFLKVPRLQASCEDLLKVIDEVMLPLIKFSPKDKELFDENPIEYIRLNEVDLVKYDVKKIVMGFLDMCMQEVQPEGIMYEEIIKMLKKKLETEPFNIINYESYIFVAERMVPAIKQISGGAGFDFFLGKIGPLIESEHSFAKFRACKTISLMVYPDMKEESVLELISSGVVKHLKDETLPVRSAAAEAMAVLFTVPVLKKYFEPHLKDILLVFLKVVNEYETDNLLAAFQSIFMIYRNEIGPFVLDLVVSLKQLLFDLTKKEDDYAVTHNDEGIMESGAAIMSTLESINEVIKAPVSNETLESLFPHIEEITHWGFKGENFESLADVIAIFSTFVTKFTQGIPDSVLGYLSIFCIYILGVENRSKIPTPDWFSQSQKTIFIEMDTSGNDGSESYAAFMPVFRNMIKLAGAQIFTKIGLNNEALIEQLIDTVKVTIERNINSNFPNTIVHALFLLGYCFNNSNLEAMKNYKVAKPFPMASENNQASGPVSFFEEILNISFSVLKANLDSAYEFALIHNVGLALHADPQSTLMHLEKSGLLQGFMQLWFKKHPKCPTIRIRKASFLAFLQLLKLDNSVLEKLGIDFKQLSGYIAKDVPILADEEVRLLSKDDKDLWEDDECYDDMDFGFDDPKFNLDKAIADTHKDLDNLKRKVDGKDEIEDGDGDDESEDEWEDEDGEEGQHETAKEERDEDQDDENAKYSLKEIDLAPDILDNLDAVNSVLSFETQFQNMAANNTQLFSLIQSHIKDEDKSHIQESLKKLKEAIAAKTQSA